MKMKKLFLKNAFMALAAMSIVACSNDDEMPAPGGQELPEVGENATIYLSIGGVEDAAKTRGQGTPITGSGTQATNLHNIAILFTDGTDNSAQILKVATMASGSRDWTNIIKNSNHTGNNGNGFPITTIPSKVKAVYVIGNYKEPGINQNNTHQQNNGPGAIGSNTQSQPASDPGDQKGDPKKRNLEKFVYDAWKATQNGTGFKTLSDLKNCTLTSASQQALDNMTVFGGDEDGLKTVSSSGNSNTFKAEVKLEHFFSRIEIEKISCTDLGTWYESLELKYMGVMNLFSDISLGGVTGNTQYRLGTSPTVEEPETNSQLTSGQLFSWGGTNGEQSQYKWSWDKVLNSDFNNGENGAANCLKLTESNKTSVTFKDKKNFCYMFLPRDINPISPATRAEDPTLNFNIKLYLAANEKSSSQEEVQSKAVSAFSTVTGNIDNQSWQDKPGYIYKVKFEFSEKNISSWDPTDDNNTVNLLVTVQPWTIVTDVTPTYE